MAKEGSTVSGLMDTIATMTSIALQYGVPLKALVDKFSHTRFEPSGFTNHPEIPYAKSIADYVFRYLGSRFLQGEAPPDEQETQAESVGLGDAAVRQIPRAAVAGGSGGVPRAGEAPAAFVNQADAPPCSDCGSITVRNGACYKCANCGLSMGCS
jgi:ribonucleoside-diphosphate reductase alpha chain